MLTATLVAKFVALKAIAPLAKRTMSSKMGLASSVRRESRLLVTNARKFRKVAVNMAQPRHKPLSLQPQKILLLLPPRQKARRTRQIKLELKKE